MKSQQPKRLTRLYQFRTTKELENRMMKLLYDHEKTYTDFLRTAAWKEVYHRENEIEKIKSNNNVK